MIRTVVLTAAGESGVEVVGIRNGFRGLTTDDFCPLDAAGGEDIQRGGGSILGCDNRFRGEAGDFARGAARQRLDGIVVVGGNGSLRLAEEMAREGVAVVGVPKTINNDVAGTEHTIGFDTAVGVVVDACERLLDTAETHRRVMILEVMGRDSGFIALDGAIAGGADVVLVPEIPLQRGRAGGGD